MKKKESILVFCAHSDDQIFGPGATLASYAKEGKDIYTYIFSYGEASLLWLKRKVAVRTRVKEAKKADKIIGGKGVFFFGLKEGKFPDEIKEKRIIRRIAKIIKEKKPGKIFTHSFNDPHPDHRIVYNAVMNAISDIKYKGDVFAFDVWNPFIFRKTFLPKLYVDATKTFDKKLRALKTFKSQKTALLTLVWSVWFRALVHGFHIHKKYAERFFKIIE